jgi:ribonucleoside-diphosphate reductase subunit M1
MQTTHLTTTNLSDFTLDWQDISQQVLLVAHLDVLKNKRPILTHVSSWYLVTTISPYLIKGLSIKNVHNILAEKAAWMLQIHTDYQKLAARIQMFDFHQTSESDVVKHFTTLYEHRSPQGNNEHVPLVNKHTLATIQKYGHILQNIIDYERDYLYGYMAVQTFLRKMAMSIFVPTPAINEDGYPTVILKPVCIERPQLCYLRIAVEICGPNPEKGDKGVTLFTEDSVWFDKFSKKAAELRDEAGNELEHIILLYHFLSLQFISAPTPAFNPGSQYVSCFLTSASEDSIAGIHDDMKEGALISKGGGGNSKNLTPIRASGSYVKGMHSTASGLAPLALFIDRQIGYVSQGNNKRPGSCALYVEMWHADAPRLIDLARTSGKEDMLCKLAKIAVWVPDLLMKRARTGKMWSYFCPTEAPLLESLWGPKFERTYRNYEKAGKARSSVPAASVLNHICHVLLEGTGPYVFMGDNINRYNMQRHIGDGKIRCSNLCGEIMQYTSPTETPTCVLLALCLVYFYMSIEEEENFLTELLGSVCELRAFNMDVYHQAIGKQQNTQSTTTTTTNNNSECKTKRRLAPKLLGLASEMCVITQNAMLDRAVYPSEKSRNSSQRHRALGLGVQGTQDLFWRALLPYASQEARRLFKRVMQTINYHVNHMSIRLAETYGPYPSSISPDNGKSFDSQGIHCFDLYSGWKHPQSIPSEEYPDYRPLFVELSRRLVAAGGKRNSENLAPMPTAGSSGLTQLTESFEPVSELYYVRRMAAGDFMLVPPALVETLSDLGLWTPTISNLIKETGSIASIPQIPESVKALFQTAYDMKQVNVLKMVIKVRGYIDQSTSTNVFYADPTVEELIRLLYYGWSHGMKTVIYYLRKKSKGSATKFTLNTNQQQQQQQHQEQEKEETEEGIQTQSSQPQQFQQLNDRIQFTYEDSCGAFGCGS